MAAVAAFASACSAESSAPPDAPECSVGVERFKEMLVVDDAVVGDARAKNATAGPWSFRYAIESMVPEGSSASQFVDSWLLNWVDTPKINGFATDRPSEGRSRTMRDVVLCPWLKQTPSNACDDQCSSCAARVLDLAKAPFRLVGVVNRMDLRERPEAGGPFGEGRMVYALTDGPADDPASRPMAMVLILEYILPSSLDLAGWADAWHHLGTHAAFDEGYRVDLESVTERFVKRNAAPGARNGSALGQVRSNESALNWIWQLREFRLSVDGQLRLAPTTNTPAEDLNGTPQLRDWVAANRQAILEDRHIVPPSMLGGAADQLLFHWTVPGTDEELRRAFARATCNGCHAGENPTIDTAFHISPYRAGVAKVSPFLNDPSKPGGDELSKREKHAREILCRAPAAPSP